VLGASAFAEHPKVLLIKRFKVLLAPALPAATGFASCATRLASPGDGGARAPLVHHPVGLPLAQVLAVALDLGLAPRVRVGVGAIGLVLGLSGLAAKLGLGCLGSGT
jgi:hypothetical protein